MTFLDYILMVYGVVATVAWWFATEREQAAAARFRLLDGMLAQVTAACGVWQERASELLDRLERVGLLTPEERLARGYRDGVEGVR
jgi:hypothetical protein